MGSAGGGGEADEERRGGVKCIGHLYWMCAGLEIMIQKAGTLSNDASLCSKFISCCYRNEVLS